MKIRHAIIFALFLFTAGGLLADQVEMQNGDRYSGKVVSMTADNVILQNDVLGKLTLPRGKVATVNLGATVAPAAAHLTNQPKATTITLTNANPNIAEALRSLGANTNFIEQIRKQFLSDAGPTANDKYDELLAGLLSGKLDMNGLRAEAKAAADQIRTLKQQGGDVGEPLDSYLAILDNFLNQTAASPHPAPPATPSTNHVQTITITR